MNEIDKLVEEKLKKEEITKVYTEKIQQYNGTGDNVVVTSVHPINTIMRYHNHDFYEMIVVQEGTCINMVEGESMHLNSGDIMIMCPDALHTLFSSKGNKESNILIRPEYFRSLKDKLNLENTKLAEFFQNLSRTVTNKYILFKNTSPATDILNLLLSSGTSPHRAVFRESLFTALLCCLDTCETVLAKSSVITSDVFKQMFSYMVANYNKVTLDSLSREYAYTKSYICKLFKKSTGATFSENLGIIRLQKAQTLLSTTNMTVEQICYNVGYESTEYFHRLFKKNFSITPLEYRKKYK